VSPAPILQQEHSFLKTNTKARIMAQPHWQFYKMYHFVDSSPQRLKMIAQLFQCFEVGLVRGAWAIKVSEVEM
jgi:hypothetical protein